MKEIGIRAYRFSISWPRVLPTGMGAANEAGIDFYDRLVDELLGRGIEPWATLFHWDYPQALFLRDGWLNPDSPKWFTDYARTVVARLSDRVRHWMTLNEPQCFVGLGHHKGPHAPHLTLPLDKALLVAHRVLLAHGMSVQAIRAEAKQDPVIGWAPVVISRFPATDSTEDIEAAKSAMFAITEKDFWNNTWWADPVILGRYPEDGLRLFGSDMPKITADEMETICQPLDFYGANIYTGDRFAEGPDGSPVKIPFPPGYKHSHFLWGVTPEVLYWSPRWLYERYKVPVVITENGMSNLDWVALDNQVHDPQRIDFLHSYLLALKKALAEGTDVRGYFVWSIMDNFEWWEGYKHRFGLIHIDYESQKRTLKDSAHWYRQVIRSNGAALLS